MGLKCKRCGCTEIEIVPTSSVIIDFKYCDDDLRNFIDRITCPYNGKLDVVYLCRGCMTWNDDAEEILCLI